MAIRTSEPTAIVGTAGIGQTRVLQLSPITMIGCITDTVSRFRYNLVSLSVDLDRCIELAMRMGLVPKIGAARVEVSSKNNKWTKREERKGDARGVGRDRVDVGSTRRSLRRTSTLVSRKGNGRGKELPN